MNTYGERVTPDRRTFLAALGAFAVLPGGCAEPAGEEMALWPGVPPGSPSPLPRRVVEQAGSPDAAVTVTGMPTLSVRRPARANGAAVLILPGGGYEMLAWGNEGEEQARWLTALGVTCFILAYRLPGEAPAHRSRVPLADAQRAVRVIRARARAFGIDPARVAVLGFSAGGHLAGSLATRFAERVYAAIDAADRLSARPALAGLIYPVVTMAAGITHPGSRAALLGASPLPDAVRAASVDKRVSAETPPVFLVHARDDGIVPFANSVLLYRAMRAGKHSVAFHGFEVGGHGFGVRLPAGVPAARWPELFAGFARAQGVLPG